ncbi:MAG: hypothetical protein JSU72_12440 [Deltaproteobacteria bacterium]|nr:MAG: hypothetical protein JSU72_12440 [Deltaproteobacteria bacterium]
MAYDPNLDKILKVGEINLQETKAGEAKSVLHINVCRYGEGECKLGLKLGFKTRQGDWAQTSKFSFPRLDAEKLAEFVDLVEEAKAIVEKCELDESEDYFERLLERQEEE